MKKLLSISLAAMMLLSTTLVSFGSGVDHTSGTEVTYVGTAMEQFTVTVPATLEPGEEGEVVAEGPWTSNRKLVVTADENVTLTNSLNSDEQKILDIEFDGIALVGSNTVAVEATQTIEVADITDALFGTWSGHFDYEVDMVTVEAAVAPSATFDTDLDGTGDVTLTWEELKLEENRRKYDINSSIPITDTTFDFAYCAKLISVTLPEGVTTIGYMAFADTSLTSITIPNSVTSIDDAVFRFVTSLKNITFNGTMAQWNTISFGDEWNLTCGEMTVTCTDGIITVPANDP